MEESQRQSYLKIMGITQWQLRSDDDKSGISEHSGSTIRGLTWLNQGSKNGLLIVFSESQSELTPEARQLMSKMLKGIHFLPAETGFAVVGKEPHSEVEAFALTSVKTILALGHEAGRYLVKISGARIIPGTEIFSLQQRKIIITTHPDELIKDSNLKQQTWKDLKQLVAVFNNS